MNEITITISGKTCTGKSSIAQLLKMLLSKYNKNIEIVDGEDGDELAVRATLEKRLLEMTRGGQKITIITQQI